MSESLKNFKMNPDNPGWIMGWGVLQKKPHDVISMHPGKAEADAEACKLGDNFEVQYGSRKLGSNDFIYEEIRLKYVNVDGTGKKYVYDTREQAVAATVNSPINWQAVAIPTDQVD